MKQQVKTGFLTVGLMVLLFALVRIATASNSLPEPIKQEKLTLAQLSQKTDFQLESTDLIANILYGRLSNIYRSMTPDGAMGANIYWERNRATRWYIEEQRYGEDLIVGGLIKNDPQAIQAGFKMFDWGFARQSPDGSFRGTTDPFHGSSFFIQAVARSLLIIQESPYARQYAAQVERYKPLLHRAARWMILPDVWNRGTFRNRPFTHRYYLVGAALGFTGKLTGDRELINYSRQYIEEGLSQQRPDGVNPERDGHDSGYQTVGVVYAQRWVTYFPNDPLTPRVIEMINKALAWEQTRILPSGEISAEGNTRTAGQEAIRTGQRTKRVGPGSQIRAFAYWASVTGDRRWEAIARRIVRFYYNL